MMEMLFCFVVMTTVCFFFFWTIKGTRNLEDNIKEIYSLRIRLGELDNKRIILEDQYRKGEISVEEFKIEMNKLELEFYKIRDRVAEL